MIRWSPGSSDPGAESAVLMLSGTQVGLAVLCFLALLLVAPARAVRPIRRPGHRRLGRRQLALRPAGRHPEGRTQEPRLGQQRLQRTEDPKSDFTTTVGAPIDWWLRMGRARFHGVDYFEGVYFATYGDQSGFNQRHELTFLVPLNRIRPVHRRLVPQHQRPPGLRDQCAHPPHRDRRQRGPGRAPQQQGRSRHERAPDDVQVTTTTPPRASTTLKRSTAAPRTTAPSSGTA